MIHTATGKRSEIIKPSAFLRILSNLMEFIMRLTKLTPD